MSRAKIHFELKYKRIEWREWENGSKRFVLNVIFVIRLGTWELLCSDVMHLTNAHTQIMLEHITITSMLPLMHIVVIHATRN